MLGGHRAAGLPRRRRLAGGLHRHLAGGPRRRWRRRGARPCPATREAMVAGELSLAQAQEITRTEEHQPGSEADLVEVAKGSPLGRLRDEAAQATVRGDRPGGAARAATAGP